MALGRLLTSGAPWRPLRNGVGRVRQVARARAQGRSYATNKTQAKQSDLPWALGAVVITVPAAAWLVSVGPDTKSHGHGMHVDHLKHDGEEDEEHETSDDAASQPGNQTEEVEGDGPEEPSEDAAEGTANEDAPSENGQSDSQEDAGDENDDAQSSEKTSPDPKDKGTAKSYYKDTNLNGESKPDISGEISKQRDRGDDKPVGDKGTKEDPKVLEYADEGEQKGFKKVTYADAKGGFKKRIEAPGGRKQGEPKPEDDKGIDPAAQSKAPGPPGTTPYKQEGVSNTDTKHPYDLESTERSKKSEGGPDTAKLTGTVDPARPQV